VYYNIGRRAAMPCAASINGVGFAGGFRQRSDDNCDIYKLTLERYGIYMDESQRLRLALTGRATSRDQIPFLNGSLTAELERMKAAWYAFQSTRDRDAVYIYLDAVYQAVMVWKKSGWIRETVARVIKGRGEDPRLVHDTFAAVIMCTADSKKVDRKVSSKWSRALRYVQASKTPSEPVVEFMKRKGGINACAARHAKRNRKPLKSCWD
jgi:hypothetical protein